MPPAEPICEVMAAYTLEEIEQVIAYDLQLVRVLGRPGVVRTYEWMMSGPSDDTPHCLKAVFRFTQGHRPPPMPAAVQSLMDRMAFGRTL